MSFDIWKTLFRKDCIANNKLSAFDSLGEHVLRILYENGLEPTIHAVVEDGINGRSVAKQSSRR